MAPRETSPEVVGGRSLKIDEGVQIWLKERREEDKIDSNLWRIHDGLYDLNDFIERHPGGPSWLEWTRGTDITEAFEVAHVFDNAEKMLKKFYVKSCKDIPRTRPYTFEHDGFYKTLRRKAQIVLREIGTGPNWEMYLVQDGLFLAFHAMFYLTMTTGWFSLALMTGFLLGMSTSAAHNFFHQRDSFRRFYWDASMFNSNDWRISHMLSHHLFTNTMR